MIVCKLLMLIWVSYVPKVVYVLRSTEIRPALCLVYVMMISCTNCSQGVHLYYASPYVTTNNVRRTCETVSMQSCTNCAGTLNSRHQPSCVMSTYACELSVAGLRINIHAHYVQCVDVWLNIRNCWVSLWPSARLIAGGSAHRRRYGATATAPRLHEEHRGGGEGGVGWDMILYN